MAERTPPNADRTLRLGERRKEEEKNFLSDLDLIQPADTIEQAIEIIRKGF